MPVFPKREAEILELAQHIISGLTASAADFPAPPVSIADLQAALDLTRDGIDTAVAARGASEIATANKSTLLLTLIAKMRANLRYAEDAVGYNDAKLTGLGWAGKALRSAQETPGQPGTLEAPQQGEGWISLDWEAPTDGGKARSYRIERRERPGGVWTITDMSFESQVTLSNQDRGKEWEYRVIAANKAGEGMPSNTVVAVL